MNKFETFNYPSPSKSHCDNKRLNGFTLAEVLITLSILGVVAALTIPNISRRVQDAQQIAGFKRNLAILDNALHTMVSTEGPVDTWEHNESDPKWLPLAQKLGDYINPKKICENSDTNIGECGPKCGDPGIICEENVPYYLSLDGVKSGRRAGANEHDYAYLLQNGATISLGVNVISDQPTFTIDYNGRKGPNKLGFDVFLLQIHPEKGYYIPVSTGQERLCMYPGLGGTSAGNGQRCAVWVLRHGNMDYKYRDVRDEYAADSLNATNIE